jgi:hypothetical protein
MITCSNCATEARYQYRTSETNLIYYCFTHLPKFLQPQRHSGALDIPAPIVEPTPAPAPAKKSTRAKTTGAVKEA